MNKRAIALAAAGLLVVAGVLLAVFHPHVSNGIRASGMIEATESDIAPKVQGRLVRILVADGARVLRGRTVAVLERTTPALSVDQARANVAAAQAQLASARSAYALQEQTYGAQLAQAAESVSIAGANRGQASQGLSIERHATRLAIDQAAAQLGAAQAAYHRAGTELARTRSLVAGGDEPQRMLDDVTAQYRSASAQLETARDALALARANRSNVAIRRYGLEASASAQRQSQAALALSRAQLALVAQRGAQVLAARAQLAQTRAALGLAQEQLQETHLIAPFDGAIVSHNFEVGDLVSPGSAVMTIADLTHPYVYVYLSETDLPRVKTGMHADVTIDGMPGKTFRGTITEIASSAEFTPENVQTHEQRIEYLVFRVKIQFTDTTGTLKPGLPVDAVIRT